MRVNPMENMVDFDVEGHVDDLVAFFSHIGLSECQMFEVLEELVLGSLGAGAVKH